MKRLLPTLAVAVLILTACPPDIGATAPWVDQGRLVHGVDTVGTVGEVLTELAEGEGFTLHMWDELDCGHGPRAGRYSGTKTDHLDVAGCYVHSPRASRIVHLTAQGTEESWAQVSPRTRSSWLAALSHEMSHAYIDNQCGSPSPAITEERYENITHALSITLFGTTRMPGTYDITARDRDTVAAILQGECE